MKNNMELVTENHDLTLKLKTANERLNILSKLFLGIKMLDERTMHELKEFENKIKSGQLELKPEGNDLNANSSSSGTDPH